MAFVKLDTGILNSTLWVERECRDVFITALLMAEPFEAETPMEQFEVHSLKTTGFVVPPGWYGLVRAAGVGICRMAMISPQEGLQALERLGAPDPESRSKDFDGRRLVRVDGGFIVLNFMKYRDRDYTSATRSKRYRERLASRRDVTTSHRDITQAEAYTEAEESKPHCAFSAFWDAYPRKKSKGQAEKAWARLPLDGALQGLILAAVERAKASADWQREGGKFIPYPATWLNARGWEDELQPAVKETFHL